MTTKTTLLRSITLAATLTLGSMTLAITPAAADPSPRSSCTGRTASTGAQNVPKFGYTIVSGTASGLAQDDDPETSFGQTIIAPEAQAPHTEPCPNTQP